MVKQTDGGTCVYVSGGIGWLDSEDWAFVESMWQRAAVHGRAPHAASVMLFMFPSPRSTRLWNVENLENLGTPVQASPHSLEKADWRHVHSKSTRDAKGPRDENVDIFGQRHTAWGLVGAIAVLLRRSSDIHSYMYTRKKGFLALMRH